MNYTCMTCGAKYAIPDERVARAGATGLRVRCTRCRVVMGVSSSAAAAEMPSSTTSRPQGGLRSRDVDDGARTPIATGVWKNPFADVAAPAIHAGSGALHAAAGVTREVTGVFAGILANVDAPSTVASAATLPSTRARVWFCAIDGRARGPYSADEMLALAHKGKVRTSTLIWRAGAAGWKPLRSIDGHDVAWLLDAARQRRQAEQRAEQDMLRRRGIVPVRLERRTVRAAPPPASSTSAPAAPAHSVLGAPLSAATFDDDVGPGALPVVGALHPLDDAGGTPFVWRAPQATSDAQRQRPRHRRAAVVAVAVVAVVAVAGLVGAGLIESGVVEAALLKAGVLPAP